MLVHRPRDWVAGCSSGKKKKKKETEKRRKTRTGKRNDFLCYARAVRCNKKQEQKKETVFAMKPERKIG